jgi:hypothetical protein
MGGKGTFGPGTARNPTDVGELDGVWAVERVSGALPPLLGCVKRIHGARGTTEFPHVPGVPFDVRGRELHYPLGSSSTGSSLATAPTSGGRLCSAASSVNSP